MVRIFFLLFPLWLFAMSKAHLPEGAIGVRTFRYQDLSRERPVAVELWYPIAERPFPIEEKQSVWIHPKEARDVPVGGFSRPLILLSHGHLGDRRDRSWLAEMLVRSGFIVASVEHYGNTWRTFSPVSTLKFWDRPRDVSFALTRLLEEPCLRGKVDPKRIGFVGYSLGGMTALALGGAISERIEGVLEKQKQALLAHAPGLLEAQSEVDLEEARRSFRDPRIRAILLLAPCIWSFGQDSFQDVAAPVGLVASLHDAVLPHQEHALVLIENAKIAALKLFETKVRHQDFVNCVSDYGKKVLHPYYALESESVDRSLIHLETGQFAISFFLEYLR